MRNANAAADPARPAPAPSTTASASATAPSATPTRPNTHQEARRCDDARLPALVLAVADPATDRRCHRSGSQRHPDGRGAGAGPRRRLALQCDATGGTGGDSVTAITHIA